MKFKMFSCIFLIFLLQLRYSFNEEIILHRIRRFSKGGGGGVVSSGNVKYGVRVSSGKTSALSGAANPLTTLLAIKGAFLGGYVLYSKKKQAGLIPNISFNSNGGGFNFQKSFGNMPPAPPRPPGGSSMSSAVPVPPRPPAMAPRPPAAGGASGGSGGMGPPRPAGPPPVNPSASGGGEGRGGGGGGGAGAPPPRMPTVPRPTERESELGKTSAEEN